MKFIQTTIDGEPVLAPHFLGTDDTAPRADYPTVERRSVVVIIRNPDTGEYLCVDAKNQDCKSFVMGGIENGESPEQAAVREVAEETGYEDMVIDKVSDFTVVNHFFAAYKNVNRYAYLKFVYGHLCTDKQREISPHEASKHCIVWVAKADLRDYLNVEMCRWAAQNLD